MTEPAAVEEGYDAGLGVEQDRRADGHRQRALEASDPRVALVHAVLALEARVEEMTVYLAHGLG